MRRQTRHRTSSKTKSTPYRSGFEQRTAADLESKGVTFEYESESFTYLPNPKKYTPDFKLPNGIFIETKGYFTSADRTKALKVRDSNPHLDCRFVFMNANNKLSKKSKTRYRDWCDKHGFMWAEKSIPLDWINE